MDANPGWLPLPEGVVLLHRTAWRCVEVLFCRFYNKISGLRAKYRFYDQFRNVVAYFWMCPKRQIIRVHYRKSCDVFKLCVSKEPYAGEFPSNKYLEHTASVFFGECGTVRMKYFEVPSAKGCVFDLFDQLPDCMPDDVRKIAEVGFYALQELKNASQ
jgi:hypothetical protein